MPAASLLTSTYTVEIGSRLEVGYRLEADTSLEVKYTPQGGQSALIASVSDKSNSGTILPFIAFEEEGVGELKVEAKLMKKDTSAELDIFGSPAVGARFRWFSLVPTGTPEPTAQNPLVHTPTASIRVVKPRRA